MNDKDMDLMLKRVFGRDWRSEALFYYRKYLAMRLRVKHLKFQNGKLRKVLFRLLRTQ